MSTQVAEPETQQNNSAAGPDFADAEKLSRARPLFDPEIVGRAARASFVKLNPITLLKNPVMFVVEVGAALTTILLIRDLFTSAGSIGFQFQISLWLWFSFICELRRRYGGSARQSAGG